MISREILRAGDWVTVRSREEILATLDATGRLDGMPFMPEMLKFCGRSFRVAARAHKTCDTVNKTGGRKVRNAVHLEDLRCDGSAHGGCQSDCLLFWHTAWVRCTRVPSTAPIDQRVCTEAILRAATTVSSGEELVFSCQTTRLPEFTEPLRWWDFRQYLEDWLSGNVRAVTLLRGAAYVTFVWLVDLAGRVSYTLYRSLIRFYDSMQHLRGGTPYPRLSGRIPVGRPTPARDLGLQPGDWVQVLPFDLLRNTLNERNRTRGMYFDAECVPFCGKRYRVRALVHRIIDERTGKMIILKGANVSLEGVACRGRYGDRRMQCPRAIIPIWKETWLERCEGDPEDSQPSQR